MAETSVEDSSENKLTVTIVTDEEIEFTVEKHQNIVTVTVNRKILDEDLPF